MAALQTSSNAALYVSAAAPATHNAAGFAALTWAKVGNVSDLGSIGKTHNPVNFQPLDKSETVVLAGNYSSGEVPCVFGYDKDDAGQTILRANVGNNTRPSFKLVMQSGEIRYFRGVIMSDAITIGTADAVTTQQASITVQNDGLGFVVV